MTINNSEKRNYIPYEEKMDIINELIDEVSFIQNGLLAYDCNEFEMKLVTTLYKVYNNVDINDYSETYDALMSGKISYEPMSKDYMDFYAMANRRMRQIEKVTNSVEAVLNRNLVEVVDALTSSIEGISKKISKTDMSKFAQVAQSVVTNIKKVN